MTCKVSYCTEDVHCKEWCVKHYTSNNRHGHPEAADRNVDRARAAMEYKPPAGMAHALLSKVWDSRVFS